MYPPDDGRPGISTKNMAWLEIDETVIELMRHLPYIYRDDHSDAPTIYTMTSMIDYRGPYVNSYRSANDVLNIEYKYPRPPPNILTLADQDCRDGCWILINPKRGTRTLHDPIYGPNNSSFGQPTIDNEVILACDPASRKNADESDLISPPEMEKKRKNNGETIALGGFHNSSIS